MDHIGPPDSPRHIFAEDYLDDLIAAIRERLINHWEAARSDLVEAQARRNEAVAAVEDADARYRRAANHVEQFLP